MGIWSGLRPRSESAQTVLDGGHRREETGKSGVKMSNVLAKRRWLAINQSVITIGIALLACGGPQPAATDSGASEDADVGTDTAIGTDAAVTDVTSSDCQADASCVDTAQVATPSNFTITCQGTSPTAIAFDFAGAKSGDTRVCTLHNEGPAPFAWSDPPQIQPMAPLTQSMAAFYDLTLQTNGQQRAKPFSAGSIAAGQSLDFTISYTAPFSGPQPWAELQISFMQAPSPPTTLAIPIRNATCDAPDLVYAPDGLWLYATTGNQAQGHVVFTNQGCAPLDIVKVCINGNNPSGSDPCTLKQYVSAHFGLATPVTATTLQPSAVGGGNGLFGLDVEFHPPDDNKIAPIGLLNVVYCVTGSVAGGDCALGYQTYDLSSDKPVDYTLPSATLHADTSKPKAGAAVWVSGDLTPGSFPNGVWRWWLIDRPAGSHAWIGASSQLTPDVLFLPDLPGSYTVQASALTMNPNVTQLAWTPPAAVTVTVL